MTDHPRRNRVIYVCSLVITAGLGIGITSRQFNEFLPGFVADYAGIALWALTVYSAIGLVFPSMPTWLAASGAYVVTALVEFSQLYHEPWIDELRGTPLGTLALGSDFVIADLACFAVVVFLAMMIEMWMLE